MTKAEVLEYLHARRESTPGLAWQWGSRGPEGEYDPELRVRLIRGATYQETSFDDKALERPDAVFLLRTSVDFMEQCFDADTVESRA